ncbi:MAG: hypothetical protein Q8P01_05270 [bacterium]|nr:hypothetical protein [bacterium]
MKLYSKLLILVLVVVVLGIALVFWWRSISGGGDEALRQGSGQEAVTSTLEFQPVPRADGSPSLFDEGPSTGSGQTDSLPTEGEGASRRTGGVARVSDRPVFYHWTNSDTGEVFYLTPDGAAYLAEAGGDIEISSQTLSGLQSAEISPKGDKVLARFGTPEFPKWGIFDVVDGVWRPLQDGILDAIWGKDSGELIARVEQGSDMSLGVLNLEKSGSPLASILRDFRLKNVSMFFLPSGKKGRLVFIEKPLPSSPSRMWGLNLDTLSFSLLSSLEKGVLIRQSPDRMIALKFASPDTFLILDKNFEEAVPSLLLTLPQKCGFAGPDVYCFEPREDIFTSEESYDDYLKQRVQTTDTLLTFGVEDPGFDVVFASGGGGIPAIDGLMPTASRGNIYFINRYDDYLYSF